ncbi:MAG: amino acid--tRNA ligase-related protein, partial [Hyphomonadaceae bacterium]
MSADSPFWSAARHADRRPFLMARARALSAVRAWFAREGFIEADVGAWVQSPGAETHIQAFETQGRFLHASPEFAMKKLLAAGEEKIFFLGKVYRAGERGPLHAPEFTMLEWYRAGAPYEAIEADSVEIARIVCESVGAQELSWRGQACDPFAAPQRLSVKDAFAAFAPSPPRGEGAASSPPP